ncbi:MAG: HEAT repeat domain-containing protein [Candidatus Omnitrophota bacterium]
MFEKKLVEEIKALISRLIWRRVIFILFIISIAIFGSIYFVYNSLKSEMITVIAQNFKNEDVKSLVKEAALEQGDLILKEELYPEMTLIKKDLKKDANSFNNILEDYKVKFKNEYETFVSDSEFLKKSVMIARLGDRAIGQGDRSALKTLEVFIEGFPEPDLMNAAQAEIRQISAFYENKKTERGTYITHFGSDGKEIKDDEMATHYLVFALRNDQSWKVRVRAANLLGNRKQRSIPETLLSVAENDSSLDVVKACMEAFSKITGYETPGILAYKQAKDWWLRNKEKINPTLSEQVR